MPASCTTVCARPGSRRQAGQPGVTACWDSSAWKDSSGLTALEASCAVQHDWADSPQQRLCSQASHHRPNSTGQASREWRGQQSAVQTAGT